MSVSICRVGLLVDKDDLLKYQLVVSYGLLFYQPTVDTGGSVDDS